MDDQLSSLLGQIKFDSPMQKMQALTELTEQSTNQLIATIWRAKWLSTARSKQVPPESKDWSIWFLCCGRGFGKTRVGAEDIGWWAWDNPGTRQAIVAPTAADVRDTCFEGDSGLVNVIPKELVDTYNRSLSELILVNGSRIKGFSADEPSRLRGPQHHRVWCDEIGSWRYPTDTMDMIEFGLRLGENPQVVITSTPIPSDLIRDLIRQSKERSDVIVVTGSTYDNKKHLSQRFIKRIEERYEGTRLGRQELHAEILEDTPGALWTMAILDQMRVTKLPNNMKQIVVGVDPATTSGTESDEVGIVCCGSDEDDHGYTIEDATVSQATPDEWAQAAIDCYHRNKASFIVVETNNGGDLVTDIIKRKDKSIPVKGVHASVGKFARAEPMAMRYEQKKMHHLGVLGKLESQLTTYVPGVAKKSPDRLDAMVWAQTALFPMPAEEDDYSVAPVMFTKQN